MKRVFGIVLLLGLSYGCSGMGYLPYSPRSLNPAQIDGLVDTAATTYKVPRGLVRAVLMAESNGDPSAVSSAGAQGLMQLMPATTSNCKIGNAFDPQENVRCGTSYLKTLLARYHNNTQLAVAAYNAGPGAVDAYHGVPPYAETESYVARVITAYRSY